MSGARGVLQRGFHGSPLPCYPISPPSSLKRALAEALRGMLGEFPEASGCGSLRGGGQ